MNPRIRFMIVAISALVVSSALTLLLLTLLDHSLNAPAVRGFDALVQARVHALTHPILTEAMLAFTFLGAIKIFAPALATVVLWLSLRGRHRPALLLGAGIAGAFALNEALKLHFHRPRPQVPWSIGDEHTFSFPSGHSLFAVVLYGTLAYLALQQPASLPRRIRIALPAVLMPLAIGCSRIYLGMHFPTDVLAGWLAGALWLAAILTIDNARPLE